MPVTTRDSIHRLATETILYGLPSVLLRLLSFITVPLYTRFLQPSDYGVIGVAGSITALLGVAMTLGMDSATAILFSAAQNRHEQRTIVTTSLLTYLTTSFLGSILLLSASNYLASHFFSGRPDAAEILHLVAVTMFLGGLATLANLLFRLEGKKWWVVAGALGHGIISTLSALLLLVVYRQGVRGIYLAQIIASAFFFVCYISVFRQYLTTKFFSWTCLSRLLRLGIPQVPAYLATWVVAMSDRLFLEHFRGLRDAGLANIAQSLAMSVGFLCWGFNQAWGPFALSIQHEPTAPSTYSKVLSYFLGITSLAAVSLSLFASELLAVLTPHSYHGAGTLVAFYAFASIGTGVYFIVSIGVNLSRRTQYIGAVGIVATVANITMNFFFVPRWGMTGAAIATLATQWLSAMFLFGAAQLSYPLPYRLDHAAAVLASAALAVIMGRAFDNAVPLLAITLKTATVFFLIGTMVSLRIITVSQLSQLFLWARRALRSYTARTFAS